MGYYYSFRYFTGLSRSSVIGLAAIFWVYAQSPLILRFIPGRFREDDLHLIDLYNPHSFPISLRHWLIVTREYSLWIRDSLILYPGQQLRIAKKEGGIRLEKHPDFLIRLPDWSHAGAYVALLDAEGRLRKGLYLAPSPQVLFLPDSGYNITREGKRIPFYLPAESATGWEYVPWQPDPITGVVYVQQTWRYTVADAHREALLYAPLRFYTLTASCEGKTIHIVWEMEVRNTPTAYRLERRRRGRWETLHILSVEGPPAKRLRQEYYDAADTSVSQYRLVYEKPPLRLESALVEARCVSPLPPLQMRAYPGYLRIRVAQSQPVRIRLLDERFTERLRLYDGWLNAGVENVFMWDTARVKQGAWVIVATPQRRYWAKVCAR